MSMVGDASGRTGMPMLPEILPRERLFGLLDEARRRPVVWIGAPAGAGKTSLAASYLRSRSLPALWRRLGEGDTLFQGISRTFVEGLSRLLEPPAVIILEDYHLLPAADSLHRVFAEVAESLPAGINLLITGRTLPPAPWARQAAARRLALIGSEELAFTLSETGEMAELLGRDLSSEHLARVHRQTEGWAAGLVLLLSAPPSSGSAPAKPAPTISDYFAEEVLSRTDPLVQDFLLRASFLPRLASATAAALTGFVAAEDVLLRLHRLCCFLEKTPAPAPAFRLHPLFRRFLRERAERTCVPSEIERLRRRAAGLLKAAGEIEEAADLYRELSDWGELLACLEEGSEDLLARARGEKVREWLEALPAPIRTGHPRISYWWGACLLREAPERSEQLFRHAFEEARGAKDPSLTLLAWSGAVEAVLAGPQAASLDPFIDWMLRWTEEDGRFPSEGIEARVAASLCGALLRRSPGHPALRNRMDRALSVAERGAEPSTRLHVLRHAALCALWTGRTAEAAMAAEGMRDLAGGSSGWRWLEVVVLYWTEGDPGKGLSALEELYAAEGPRPLLLALGVWGHLLAGDLAEAERLLERMKESLAPERRREHGRYHYFAAWYSLRAGRLPQARLHAEEAARIGKEIGAVLPALLARLALAQVLAAAGEAAEASALLESDATEIARSGSRALEFTALLCGARLAQRRPEGVELLRRAFALGAREGYSYPFAWWEPEVMARLCAAALEAGIEATYVQGLVRRCRLMPDPPPIHLPAWPFPVKIHTLGRFSLLVEGAPVRFPVKAQQKPLELLKALIALGGRNVAAQQLCDLLWPDADGDAAHAAFTTTLHRLRKLIRRDGALRLAEGRLSLDPRLCWVDTWAFQNAAGEADAGGNADQALSFYSGNFLAAENFPWAIPFRDRLRAHFLRIVHRTGLRLEDGGEPERAMELYRRGLDADPLAEELYCRLIACSARLGRTGEAASTYRRCCEALAAEGLSPSPRLQELYRRSAEDGPLPA